MNSIVISIIIKDLKTIFSDKKALAIIIIMPLVLMTILSFALKGSFVSSDDLVRGKINIAVVKQYDEIKDSQMFINTLNSDFLRNGMGEDTTDELISSKDEVNIENIFFKDFLGSDEVSKVIKYSVEEENKAKQLMDNGEVSAIVLLPEKFIFDMKMNLLTPFRNMVNLKILTHPDRNLDGQIVKAVLQSYSNAMSSVIIGKNVIIEASLTNNIENSGVTGINQAMNKMKDEIEKINIKVENVMVEGRKNISSADYYAVAMLSMFILYAASHGGRMLLEEKQNITLQRMIIAGVSRFKILTGKFLAIFFIALIQIIVMIVFSHFALKVQWGNIYSVILISCTNAFAVAGIGLFIASATYKSNNYKVANIFETAVIQAMALMGGSFFPIEVMPETLQKFSFLSINGIALKAYLKVMVGFSTVDIINYISVLAGIGILFILFAVFIFREKEMTISDKHNKVKTAKAQG